MLKNTGKTLSSIQGPPNLMGVGDVVDPMVLLGLLLAPEAQPSVHPLIAQMLGTSGNRRVRQIDEAVGSDDAAFSAGAPVTESVPVAPQRSTAELLRAIDRMAVKPMDAKKVKVKVEVVPVTVHTRDGEELKYRDKKTGKLYDFDPNE